MKSETIQEWPATHSQVTESRPRRAPSTAMTLCERDIVEAKLPGDLIIPTPTFALPTTKRGNDLRLHGIGVTTQFPGRTDILRPDATGALHLWGAAVRDAYEPRCRL